MATLSGSVPAAAEPGTAPASALQKAPEDPATPKDPPADTLGSHDAGLLAEAEAKHEPAVTVIIATDKGRTADVAAKVKGLGGTVTRRFDQVGYVLATVPTGKVLNTAKLAGIAAVDLDETIQLPKPAPATAGNDMFGNALSGIATGSQTRWIAINPWGVPVEDTATANCYKEYTIDVPAGVQRLDVSIGNPGDAASDLDLTVYRDEGAVVGRGSVAITAVTE